MIFDSHAHYEDERFNADRVDLLSNMRQNNIEAIVNVGSYLDTSRASIDLAQKYEGVYASVGIHPSEVAYPVSGRESEIEGINSLLDKYQVSDIDDIPLSKQADYMADRNSLACQYGKKQLSSVITQLRELSQSQGVVAIGEIGLDYYWDKDPGIRALEREYFLAQLDLALELDLPVIIHSRDAADETFQIMKDYRAKGLEAVIHCYSSSMEMAREYVKLGYYIGVGGVLTFKNGRRLRESAEAIPMEYILLETDAPYMAPEPHRGERNDSRYIEYVADKLAEIKGLSKQEVIDITTDNSYRFYRINK